MAQRQPGRRPDALVRLRFLRLGPHTLSGTSATKHSELQSRAENVLINNSPPQITLSRPLPSPYTPKPPGCAVSAYSELVHGMPGSQRTGSGKRCPCRGDGHAQPIAHRQKDAVLPTLHHRKSSQRAFLLKLVQNRDTTKPCYLRFAHLKLQRSKETHGRETGCRQTWTCEQLSGAGAAHLSSPAATPTGPATPTGASPSEPRSDRGHAHRASPAHRAPSLPLLRLLFWLPPLGS